MEQTTEQMPIMPGELPNTKGNTTQPKFTINKNWLINNAQFLGGIVAAYFVGKFAHNKGANAGSVVGYSLSAFLLGTTITDIALINTIKQNPGGFYGIQYVFYIGGAIGIFAITRVSNMIYQNVKS